MMMSLVMLLGFIAIIALPTVFWLYALADVIINSFRSFLEKLLWFMVLCFFPPLGTILYFIIGRSQRITYYPVGKLVIFLMFVVPAVMIAAYILYALGHLTFMPEPPRAIQI